ncbi:MAG: glycosyltransferase [Brumimicrobium sp.]|nr:glycosyltransferase [Brumimicrobium sp.]
MDRKIKVVRIINRFNIGGPTYNATFLTKFLGEDFETVLIGGVPDEGEKDSLHILEEYGVKPMIIPELQRNPSLKSDIRAYRKLKKIIREVKPDIVHTHASKAGFLGRMAAFRSGVPVIIHTFHGHVFHSYFSKLKTRVFKMIERFLARRSEGIIAISELQKKELVDEHRIAENKKVEVIPLGFDLDKFIHNGQENRLSIRKKYALEDNTVAIAIIGRLAPIKDHDYFLDVVENLLGSTGFSTSVKIFIVGDGSEHEHIAGRVKRINEKYGAIIIMTSWILNIAEFNNGMDIICLTSKNEGTPVSIIEAQAAGLPVISTDVGGVRDIIDDGGSGFVIKRENIETYVEKLRLLVENQNLRNTFAEHGRTFVYDRFHYQRLVRDTRDYYKRLLKK